MGQQITDTKVNNFYLQDVLDEHGIEYIIRKPIHNYHIDMIYNYREWDYYPMPYDMNLTLYKIINTNNPLIREKLRRKKIKNLISSL